MATPERKIPGNHQKVKPLLNKDRPRKVSQEIQKGESLCQKTTFST